jgi:hypothetical protein
MANRGRRRGPRDGGDHDRDRDDGRDSGDRGHRHPNPRGRDFPAFLKVRTARWIGSAPATAEAYARALAQWRQLPGAISVTTTDLGEAPKRPGDEAPAKDEP